MGRLKKKENIEYCNKRLFTTFNNHLKREEEAIHELPTEFRKYGEKGGVESFR